MRQNPSLRNLVLKHGWMIPILGGLLCLFPGQTVAVDRLEGGTEEALEQIRAKQGKLSKEFQQSRQAQEDREKAVSEASLKMAPLVEKEIEASVGAKHLQGDCPRIAQGERCHLYWKSLTSAGEAKLMLEDLAEEDQNIDKRVEREVEMEVRYGGKGAYESYERGGSWASSEHFRIAAKTKAVKKILSEKFKMTDFTPVNGTDFAALENRPSRAPGQGFVY